MGARGNFTSRGTHPLLSRSSCQSCQRSCRCRTLPGQRAGQCPDVVIDTESACWLNSAALRPVWLWGLAPNPLVPELAARECRASECAVSQRVRDLSTSLPGAPVVVAL